MNFYRTQAQVVAYKISNRSKVLQQFGEKPIERREPAVIFTDE